MKVSAMRCVAEPHPRLRAERSGGESVLFPDPVWPVRRMAVGVESGFWARGSSEGRMRVVKMLLEAWGERR